MQLRLLLAVCLIVPYFGCVSAAVKKQRSLVVKLEQELAQAKDTRTKYLLLSKFGSYSTGRGEVNNRDLLRAVRSQADYRALDSDQRFIVDRYYRAAAPVMAEVEGELTQALADKRWATAAAMAVGSLYFHGGIEKPGVAKHRYFEDLLESSNTETPIERAIAVLAMYARQMPVFDWQNGPRPGTKDGFHSNSFKREGCGFFCDLNLRPRDAIAWVRAGRASGRAFSIVTESTVTTGRKFNVRQLARSPEWRAYNAKHGREAAEIRRLEFALQGLHSCSIPVRSVSKSTRSYNYEPKRGPGGKIIPGQYEWTPDASTATHRGSETTVTTGYRCGYTDEAKAAELRSKIAAISATLPGREPEKYTMQEVTKSSKRFKGTLHVSISLGNQRINYERRVNSLNSLVADLGIFVSLSVTKFVQRIGPPWIDAIVARSARDRELEAKFYAESYQHMLVDRRPAASWDHFAVASQLASWRK